MRLAIALLMTLLVPVPADSAACSTSAYGMNVAIGTGCIANDAQFILD